MEWNSKAEIFIICTYIVIPTLIIGAVIIGLIILLRNFIKSRNKNNNIKK